MPQQSITLESVSYIRGLGVSLELTYTLLGCAGVPVWIGIMRFAVPVAAARAMLLRAVIARFIDM